MKPTWVAFEERWPAENEAPDDPSVKTVPAVLVTNNLKARNRMGQMSHVWYAAPIRASKPNVTGPVVAFDEADRQIQGITHWLEMDGLHLIAAEGEQP